MAKGKKHDDEAGAENAALTMPIAPAPSTKVHYSLNNAEIVRIECVKICYRFDWTAAQITRNADALARYVLTGIVPAQSE